MQVNEARTQNDDSSRDKAIFDAIKSVDDDMLVDEVGNFLKLLGSQYKSCNPDSPELSFVGTVDKSNVDKLGNTLMFTNYTPSSLLGEVVVLFQTPVFVSDIRTSRITVLRKPGDAIRLISYTGSDKKVSSNPKSFHLQNNQSFSLFEVYGLVWGFILPKSLSFQSAFYLNFQDLFENRELLESLADSREKLKGIALEYKKKAEKSIRITSGGVKALTSEYEEIKTSISIQLGERTRLSESIDEATELKERLEREIDTANSKLAIVEEKLKTSRTATTDSYNEMAQIRNDLDESTSELKVIVNKIQIEQTNLEKRQDMVRKTQSEMDSYSLDMNGFSKASRIHIWFCYAVVAVLLITLSKIFFMIYNNATDLIKYVDSTGGKVLVLGGGSNTTSVLDILLSRLPAITATTLIIATLSTLLFFLVKHIVALHTDKMNMLKASILSEQVTYSLDCDGMKDSEVKELKRKSKIELLVRIFGLNGSSGSSSEAIDSNKQIDLIAKVVETLKSKS